MSHFNPPTLLYEGAKKLIDHHGRYQWWDPYIIGPNTLYNWIHDRFRDDLSTASNDETALLYLFLAEAWEDL